MKKRVDRNKKLYEEVEKEIIRRANASSNNTFKETNATLKAINPALFGDEIQTIQTKSSSKKLSKKTIASLIVFIVLVILVILVVVGVYYGTK